MRRHPSPLPDGAGIKAVDSLPGVGRGDCTPVEPDGDPLSTTVTAGGTVGAAPAASGSATHRPQALLLSVNEAALLLGIHRATVYDLLASGQLRSTTLGRRRVIPRAAVEAFVAALDERAQREASEQRLLAAECRNDLERLPQSA